MQNIDDEILDQKLIDEIDKSLLEFEEAEAKGTAKFYTREEVDKILDKSTKKLCTA